MKFRTGGSWTTFPNAGMVPHRTSSGNTGCHLLQDPALLVRKGPGGRIRGKWGAMQKMWGCMSWGGERTDLTWEASSVAASLDVVASEKSPHSPQSCRLEEGCSGSHCAVHVLICKIATTHSAHCTRSRSSL